MIEKTLREKFEPLVKRRHRLIQARALTVCWLSGALLGIVLLGMAWLGGWQSLWIGVGVLFVTLAGVVGVYRWNRRLQPDWGVLARRIEQRHPDIKALLLTAIEQEPQGPQGRLSYMQRGVIKEALIHATGHDWSQSVPRRTLLLSQVTRAVTFLLFAAVLSQWLPPLSFLPQNSSGVLAQAGYQVTVHPGDTAVEAGTPVVVVARFAGRVPERVRLVHHGIDQAPQQTELTKNLGDPVFGGMIPEVSGNLMYHIEYAGRRTQDYQVTVFEHPALTRMDANIIFPEYTQLPDKEIADTRQVSVVEGSEVTLTFIFNKALRSAYLAPDQGIRLALEPGDFPNVFTAVIRAAESQRYRLHLTDARGLENKLPPRITLDVFKNRRPELKAMFPNRDVVASPLEELTLSAEVSDDFELVDSGVTFNLAGSAHQEVPLNPLSANESVARIDHLLALEDLQAQPNQLLTYHFWADDRGPDGEIRRTASDIYFAVIRPFEEIFRETQNGRNQQGQAQQGNQGSNGGGEELARLQKQIISATWNIKQGVDRSGDIAGYLEDVNVVNDSQAAVQEQVQAAMLQAMDATALLPLQEALTFMQTARDHLTQAIIHSSAEDLSPALAAEQSAYQELLKLRKSEYQVGQSRNGRGSRQANSGRQQQQLRQLELRQEEDRYETQRLAQATARENQQEDLQFHNRLRDLARRQNEMAKKLKEAQAALEQARNEDEKQKILRELKRLREEQLDSLRDLDEVQRRMERSENRQRLSEAREQLEQSRQRVQRSTEDLERGMVSQAISETTRAQRELEEMRNDFRRKTASEFSQEMRSLRDQAQELDREQEDIAEEIKEFVDSQQKTLSDTGKSKQWAERVEQQQQRTETLIEEMRQVSEQSETPEPLLSRKLYDTLRRAQTENVEKTLEITEELLRRNFLPQAQEVEEKAAQGIEQLRQGVEDAARHVLGDESEALRLAREELDDLIRQAEEEVARAERANQNVPRDVNGVAENQSPNGRGRRQARADGEERGRRGRRREPAAPRDEAQNTGGRQGGQEPDSQSAEARRNADPSETAPSNRASDNRNRASAGGGGNPEGPFTGGDYRQWSQRLRDVEEMLEEPELRNQAARVRDRARDVRIDYARHGREPQWDWVQAQIMEPLAELRKQLNERLAQLQSDQALVPIDRDPVPDRYTELVQRYFETLGDKQ